MATPTILKETQSSLQRIQQFEATTLARTEDLGREMNFSPIVPAAERIVELYQRVQVSILDDLTDEQLQQIRSLADADYNVFAEILAFSATRSDAVPFRTQLINNAMVRRDQIFTQLWQFVAYGAARATNTALLESQARGAIQAIADRTNELTEKLKSDQVAAEGALKAIRAAALEQGVSQQAEYFKTEADSQEINAGKWLTWTVRAAVAVLVCAVLSLGLHKISWLHPESPWESAQLFASKFLFFAVLGYALVLCARNYSASKHNAVVNRHRQNALLTYRAIATAAGEKGTEDIILANASACIFSPQETGYSGSVAEGAGGGAKSVLELMTKSPAKAAA